VKSSVLIKKNYKDKNGYLVVEIGAAFQPSLYH